MYTNEVNLLNKIEQKLVHSFWFLPPDIHERQRFIKSKIPSQIKVLDVGGEQPVLEQIADIELFTINVAQKINQTPAYIKNPQKNMLYDGKHLPFDDDSFEMVVNIDVLEHIKPKERTDFIQEMLRVAKNKLICSAPLGTKTHVQAEKDLLKSIADQKEASFLKDHIEKGLPAPAAVKSWADQFNGQLSYSGDFRWSNLLYKIQLSEVKIIGFSHLYFLAKLFFYFTCNFCLYPFLVNHQRYSDCTNRFYLEIEKNQ